MKLVFLFLGTSIADCACDLEEIGNCKGLVNKKKVPKSKEIADLGTNRAN